MSVTPIRKLVVDEAAHHPSVLNRPLEDVLSGSGYRTDGTDFAGFAKKDDLVATAGGLASEIASRVSGDAATLASANTHSDNAVAAEASARATAVSAEATARTNADAATLASARSYADALTTLTSLVTVGALAAGSIVPGFGDINIGTHALTAGSATINGVISQVSQSEVIYNLRYMGGASLTVPTTTTILGRFYWSAYDGAGWGITATIVGEALGSTWSQTDHHGQLAFQAVPLGSIAVTTMARLGDWRFYVVENADDAIGPSLAMTKSRGTNTAPTYPQANDVLGNLEWRGYDQSTVQYLVQARIYATTPANWSAADHSTQLLFTTTATGSTAQTERWVMTASGHFRPYIDNAYDIGSSSILVRAIYTYTLNVSNGTAAADANLILWSAAGQNRQIQFATGSNGRWAIGADNGAESGSDAGSGLYIRAKSDAGTTIDTVISCPRAAGFAMTLSRPIAFSSKVGFNGAAPLTKPAITGSRASNAALASLLTQMATYGLITDSTTA